jgi:hypothetical protein
MGPAAFAWDKAMIKRKEAKPVERWRLRMLERVKKLSAIRA